MIPIIYDTNETEFESNGLGRLRDCISCIVTEERNGIYECDFEYPITGANYDLIQMGRVIGVVTDDTDDFQPFDIVSFTRPIDGIVTFHCTHISYRQSYLTVTGTNINSLADAFTLLSNAEPNNPFTYQTDKDSTGYLASADGVPKSVRSMLGGMEGSILDTYGGEYEWDKFRVILHSARGSLRNFTIRYGVNMLDYNEELDASGTYMSCIPYWTDGTTTIVGDRQDSTGSTITGRGECVPLDVSDKFESQPTKAQVEAMGLSVMNSKNPTIPSQNIHVEFARLQDMGEYAEYANLLQCGLCDTIKVVFPFYGTTGQFKIVRTVWDVLADRYESMELGDLSITLSEALGIMGGGSESKSVGGYSETLIATESYTSGAANTWTKSVNITIPSNGLYRIRASFNNTSVYGVAYSTTSATAIQQAVIIQEDPTGASVDTVTNLYAGTWSFWTKCATASASNSIYIWKINTGGGSGGGGGSGATSYIELTDKPSIEGVTLTGNKTFPNLNLNVLSNSDIQDIFDNLI